MARNDDLEIRASVTDRPGRLFYDCRARIRPRFGRASPPPFAQFGRLSKIYSSDSFDKAFFEMRSLNLDQRGRTSG